MGKDSRRPAGRAGSSPAGPAGVRPGARTIFGVVTTQCICQKCSPCICDTVHQSGRCACCRAQYHDQRCVPPEEIR